MSTRQFLKRLKDYGVILERQGDGSRNILLNTTNNKRTSFHSHSKGTDISPYNMHKMLISLDINPSTFMSSKVEEDVPEEDVKKNDIKNWQQQPWFQNQLKYVN